MGRRDAAVFDEDSSEETNERTLALFPLCNADAVAASTSSRSELSDCVGRNAFLYIICLLCFCSCVPGGLQPVKAKYYLTAVVVVGNASRGTIILNM